MKVYNFAYGEHKFYHVDKQKLYDMVYNYCTDGYIDLYDVCRDDLHTDDIDDYNNAYEIFFDEHTIEIDYETYLSEFFSGSDVYLDTLFNDEGFYCDDISEFFLLIKDMYKYLLDMQFVIDIDIPLFKEWSLQIIVKNDRIEIKYHGLNRGEVNPSWLTCLALRIQKHVKEFDVKVVIL